MADKDQPKQPKDREPQSVTIPQSRIQDKAEELDREEHPANETRPPVEAPHNP